MTAQQYDEIGEAYEGFKALPLEQYAAVPSFLGMVGDVRGKSVLDLASGTGFYSREFKRRGAADVYSVDISSEMVAVSRQIEESEPLGIRYEVADVAELPVLDRRFDIALGVQCLNYAPDIATMERMCRNIHQNLVEGGDFFLLVQSSDYRPEPDVLAKYGFRCEPLGEEIETGPRERLTALLDPPVSFVVAAPRREVYEASLKAAGFSNVTRVPLTVSEAGVREFGEEFWADFRANPPLEMLRCRA